MEVQWPLVLFTLFLCLLNGLVLVQGILLVQGKGSNKFHQVTAISAFVAMVIGGIAVFFHLQHWERIFNGFGHLTSGITHELIFVVVAAVVLIVLFVQLRKHTDEAPGVGKVFGVILIVLSLFGIFFTGHSYDMYAIPAWNNAFLYLYYLSSALLLGATGYWVIAAALKETELAPRAAKCTLVAAIVSAIVVIAAVIYIANIDVDIIDGITFYTYDPTHAAADPEASLAAPLSGDYAGMFWGGVVALGCVVPAILAAIAMAKKSLANNIGMGTVALICALAGGILYRVILYVVAIHSYVYFF